MAETNENSRYENLRNSTILVSMLDAVIHKDKYAQQDAENLQAGWPRCIVPTIYIRLLGAYCLLYAVNFAMNPNGSYNDNPFSLLWFPLIAVLPIIGSVFFSLPVAAFFIWLGIR